MWRWRREYKGDLILTIRTNKMKEQAVLKAIDYISRKYKVKKEKLRLDRITEKSGKYYVHLSWRPLIQREKFVCVVEGDFVTIVCRSIQYVC